MISAQVHSFRAVSDLQKLLDKQISSLKEESEKLSVLIGEKLRATDNSDSSDLQELREKIEGETSDPKKTEGSKHEPRKKRKVTKKKGQKNNWYNLDAISVYDGIGLKGELEIYFKVLEETKSELDRVTKVKQSIDDLVERGVRKELGCVIRIGNENPAELAFFKMPISRRKFAFKSIFSVPKEYSYEL